MTSKKLTKIIIILRLSWKLIWLYHKIRLKASTQEILKSHIHPKS